MIKLDKISKAFSGTTILDEISITIKAGELTVLIGPSGCGKTTMLKMINRMLEPTSGEITINGQNVNSIDKVKLRRDMGYVIQQGGLFPHLTIRENIEIIERMENVPEETISARTEQLMHMVHMEPEEYLDRFPSELSGGQQQRIGVARAFANDPEIILFDEPFSALDPITRNSLQDQLIEIQSKMAKTMVFVTHDMSEAIKIADRICILNDGHVVQFDTPERILRHPADEFVESFLGTNRIWNSPEYIKVKDFMIKDPIVTNREVSAYKCIRIMRSHHIDTLPVVDDDGVLLGIIGKKSFFQEKNPPVRADDMMVPVECTVSPDDSILDVLEALQTTESNNIPVVDDKGRMVGLLTSSNLVTTLSQQFLDKGEEALGEEVRES